MAVQTRILLLIACAAATVLGVVLWVLRDRVGSDPRTRAQRRGDLAALVVVLGIYFAAWWFGVLLDLLLLWFVPVVIAKVVMDWYINYLPHVGLPPGRYAGTRILDVGWFTPLVLGHNYHAIHHLWPNLPWYRYRAVFRERLASLREHGVPIETRLFGYAPRAAAATRQDSVSG